MSTANKEHRALVIVDMQNAFCSPTGSFARLGYDMSGCIDAIPGCARALALARRAEIPIVFATYAYRPDYIDGGYLVRSIHPEVVSVGALLSGTSDVSVVEDLAPRKGELMVVKNRYSAFMGTSLEAILRSRGITSLTICGVTTNVCVESTARDAAQLDFEVTVARDATGEIDEERGRVALRSIEHACGRVLTVEEIGGEWNDIISRHG